MNQVLPCPDCQTDIPFDARLLVQGQSFKCPNCSVVISLTPTATPVVKDALDKMDEIKNKAIKDSQQSNDGIGI